MQNKNTRKPPKMLVTFNKKPLQERITYVTFFTFFVIMAAIMLYPFVWAFLNSMKGSEEFASTSTFAPPKVWLFDNYIKVFQEFTVRDATYFDMLFNSVWILVVKVFVNILSSLLLAYPIAKFRFPGKNFLYALVVFIQTIPIIGAGATTYKLLYNLNMIDNPWLIWMAWAGGFDFAFIVFYGAFKGVSKTYSEAAYIDGASNFHVMTKIVVPQVIPSVVAIMITQSIAVWNDYTTTMIYLREYPNLSYGLYQFRVESMYVENAQAIYLCAVLISMIPPVLLYALNQKILLTNMNVGGIKG